MTIYSSVSRIFFRWSKLQVHFFYVRHSRLIARGLDLNIESPSIFVTFVYITGQEEEDDEDEMKKILDVSELKAEEAK